MARPRIAFLINHAAFFVSHRLPIAIAARDSGFDVKLFTGKAGSLIMEQSAVKRLSDERIEHSRSCFSSSGLSPLSEGVGFFYLAFSILRFRPEIIHCASPKAVIYGGIIARLCKINGLVIAISGKGYAFTTSSEHDGSRKILKSLYQNFFSWILRHPNAYVIVQNHDDLDDVVRLDVVNKQRVLCIPGSGVMLKKYIKEKKLAKENIVLFPARMLRDKGVEDFVEAAKIVRKYVPGWRFVAAGAADYINPSAVSKEIIARWVDDGVIEWLDHVEDMVDLFQRSAIVCLPSYREGFPKSLIEAAASGCAVITTDAIGCREAIYPGVTGDLVPVRNPKILADTIYELIKDGARREAYSSAGIKMAIERFSLDDVVEKTLSIYKEIILNNN